MVHIRNVPSLTGINWTAIGAVDITTQLTGSRTFEEVFGTFTGTITARAPAGGLTITATPEQVAQITLPAGSNITIATLITVTDGAGASGSESYLQLYPLTGTNTEAASDADDVLVAAGRNLSSNSFVINSGTYPVVTEGARFVLVWTRPGYDEVRQIIGPLAAGNTTVQINQTRNILATIAPDANPNFSIDGLYDETNNRVDYFINQGTSPNASAVGTNFLFEQAKSDAGVGEYIAKNPANDVDLITHTSQNATSLRIGTYQLRAGAGAPQLQQTIAFVSEEDPAGGSTDGQSVTVIATVEVTLPDSSTSTLPEIVVGPEVTAITYGEVDSIVTSNRQVTATDIVNNNTNIRSIVDEELDRGTVTRIGRP